MRNLYRAACTCFVICAIGCGGGAKQTTQQQTPAVDSEFARYLKNATVRQLMEDIRTKNVHEKVSLRLEVNELRLRGFPIFLEVADYFLDENEEVRRAAWCVIAEVSQAHYGFVRSSYWPEEKRKEWQSLWLQGPFNGAAAETAADREALVKKWKQWYADNVEKKRKI